MKSDWKNRDCDQIKFTKKVFFRDFYNKVLYRIPFLELQMSQSSASLRLLLSVTFHSLTFLRIYPSALSKMLTKCNVFRFGKYNITFCTISSNEAAILHS